MKNLILSVLVFAIFFTALGLIGGVESHDKWRNCEVVEVECYEVTIKTQSGHKYTFLGEGYEVGDIVEVIAENNHTGNPTDDKIVKVEKVG